MRANELAGRLALQAEMVASYLLPDGKRDGAEWVCGNLSGEAGKSLKVHLTGTKAGVWKDFSEGSSGDMVGLWMATRNIGIGEALKEIKEYLGIQDTQVHREEPLPKLAIADKSDPEGAVLAYLNGRGLDKSLKAYKIQQHGSEIIFPYLVDKSLAFAKYRSIHDKKKMRVLEGSKSVLFGWQAIPDTARAVVICEGEIDALSWYEMGAPALSVPNGAQGLGWIEAEFNRLERFDRIYIAFDSDLPGREGAAKLLDRLGVERCLLVDTGPYKDANDVLMAGADGKAFLKNAVWVDPHELKGAETYTDSIIKMHEGGWDSGPGFDTPWPKLKGLLRFREAELTIINGVNGHGKSQLVGQLALHALQAGVKGVKASLELKPERLLYRMARQAAAGELTAHKIKALGNWYTGKFWVFDLVGTAKADRLLEVFTYARKRYDVRLFVVDSLLKVGIAEDDYNGQKAFVERLADFKNQYDCHVFLVTHSRKGESEEKPTGKMDVRGSGSITDLADTVISIWRNKRKEEKIQALTLEHQEVPKALSEEYDAVLSVNKQRNGEWEGKASLWFDRQTNQFLGGRGAEPISYGGVRLVS